MKDKEKQIEEMAKLIDDRLVEANGYLGSMNKGEGYWIAQELVKHYQPKLPEDSVVLSKGEYEDLQVGKDFDYGYHEGYKNTEAYYENFKLPEIRKETAEKFYDSVKKKIEQIEKFYFDNGKIGYNGLTVKELNKLAKQFGVEISEQ